MSFWDLGDGKSAVTEAAKGYEAPSTNFLYPEGTKVLCRADDAAWKDTRDGSARYINIKWVVMKPDAVNGVTYAGRVIWQKLWVEKPNPFWAEADRVKKRIADLKKLASIDAFSKGLLSKSDDLPDETQLSLALIGAHAVLSMGYIKAKKEGDQDNNWIKGIYPKTTETTEATKAAPVRQKPPAFAEDLDDDEFVPF